MNTAQLILWGTALAVAVLPLLFAIIPWFRNPILCWYVREVALILGHNNTRGKYGVVLMVLLWASAFLAGFGKPLLDDTPKTHAMIAKTQAAVTQNTNQREAWYMIFSNGRKPPVTAQTPAPAPAKPSSPSTGSGGDGEVIYPSWWHWLAAILFSCFAIPYWVLAWREEVGGWMLAIAAYFRRREDGTVHGDDDEAPAPAPPAPVPAPDHHGPIREAGLAALFAFIGHFLVNPERIRELLARRP